MKRVPFPALSSRVFVRWQPPRFSASNCGRKRVLILTTAGRLTNRWTAAKGDTFYHYDPIGNLTNVDYPGTVMDIVLQYDGLNRLTNVVDALGTTRFSYTAAGQLLSEDGPWADDTVKVVKTWTGSAFGSPVTNRFVYDGWNLIVILNSQSSILQSFTWGQDLSGTMQGAGGIGGLLLVTAHGGANTNCFAGYDGNGNVMLLVNAGDRSTAARYEYSAFGETLRATGPLAKLNPFRFSTKFADGESGLVYFGARYFAPMLGRFVNRDPIEEEGGVNLYVFVGNRPIGVVDPWGEEELTMLYDLVDNLENLGGDFVLQAMNSHIAIPIGGVNEFILEDLRGGTISGLRQFGAATRVSASGMNVGTAGLFAAAVASNSQLFQGQPIGDLLIRLGDYGHQMMQIQGMYNARTSDSYMAMMNRMAGQHYPGKSGNTQAHHIIPIGLGGLRRGKTVDLDAAYHQLISNALWPLYGQRLEGDDLLRGLMEVYGIWRLM